MLQWYACIHFRTSIYFYLCCKITDFRVESSPEDLFFFLVRNTCLRNRIVFAELVEFPLHTHQTDRCFVYPIEEHPFDWQPAGLRVLPLRMSRVGKRVESWKPSWSLKRKCSVAKSLRHPRTSNAFAAYICPRQTNLQRRYNAGFRPVSTLLINVLTSE